MIATLHIEFLRPWVKIVTLRESSTTQPKGKLNHKDLNLLNKLFHTSFITQGKFSNPSILKIQGN